MFELVQDPIFYAVAIPAVLIAAISKGGLGGGIGMVATPLMALGSSPVQAAAIMLPILCLMDLLGIVAYRKIASWKNIVRMAPGAVIGIAIGGLTFEYMNDDIIRIIIGVIALAFALRALIQSRDPGPPQGISTARGAFWGGVSGFTSFVAHAGSPPAQVYLLPQRLEKMTYLGTTVWFFLMVNYVKLIPYAWLGQFSPTNLGTSIVLLPLAPLGIWIGFRLQKVINEAIFYRMIYILMIIVGGKLLYDGVTGLFT